MTDHQGHQPRRLSPLTPLVRGGIVVVAALATTWDDLLTGRIGSFGLILLGVLVAGAVMGYASWLRTKYWVEDDEVRIDTGVISQQSRRIRIDRLQGVDIVQPLVARLLGLAELRLDTAGGDREGKLAFLPLAEAHRLRESLLARRDDVRRGAGGPGRAPGDPGDPDGSPGAGDAGGAGDPRADWAPPDHDIAALDLRTLLLSTLLSPMTVAVVLGAVVVGVGWWTGRAGALATMLPVVGGFLLVQVRRLTGYHGFTVAQTRSGLQVRRGLFERSTQTIALARVQGVLVTEPLLWRPFGWARLDVSIAGYGSGVDSDGAPAATTVMPVAPRALVLSLAAHLLGVEDHPHTVRTTPPPASARWLEPIGRRYLGAGLGTDLAVARDGRFTRRTHAVRHARIQSLRLSQGPVQRRLRLADVHLDSPPGPVGVRFRHRGAAEARRLLDEAEARARSAR